MRWSLSVACMTYLHTSHWCCLQLTLPKRKSLVQPSLIFAFVFPKTMLHPLMQALDFEIQALVGSVGCVWPRSPQGGNWGGVWGGGVGREHHEVEKVGQETLGGELRAQSLYRVHDLMVWGLGCKSVRNKCWVYGYVFVCSLRFRVWSLKFGLIRVQVPGFSSGIVFEAYSVWDWNGIRSSGFRLSYCAIMVKDLTSFAVSEQLQTW